MRKAKGIGKAMPAADMPKVQRAFALALRCTKVSKSRRRNHGIRIIHDAVSSARAEYL